MSEMVEQVAKAIEPKFRGFGQGDMPMLIAKEVARAAIEAMREPTEAMCDDGDVWADGPGYSERVWHAMIDVALKEGT